MLSLFPVLWRYLIRRYLALLMLATGSILLLLLTSRLEEVAKFIAIGASPVKIAIFTLYQIPYILQIALPLGAFIAAYALSSKMSQFGEITALRSLGKSIFQIVSPILITSTLISLLTFLYLFDLAVKSHFATKKLEYDVQAHEPLALLQSGRFLSQNSIALELSGSLKTGSKAKNVLIAMMPKGQERLTLLMFAEAKAEEHAFTGKTLTIFSTTEPTSSTHPYPETLCIENAVRKRTPTHYVHEMTQKKNWNVGADHLKMSAVIAMQKELREKIAIDQYEGKPRKSLVKRYGRFISEPWRRLSLSIAITTLTYTGFLFGITIKRSKAPLHLFISCLPFFLFIGFYLIGKNIDEIPSIAIFAFMIPHLLLFSIIQAKKKKIEKGVSR